MWFNNNRRVILNLMTDGEIVNKKMVPSLKAFEYVENTISEFQNKCSLKKLRDLFPKLETLTVVRANENGRGHPERPVPHFLKL